MINAEKLTADIAAAGSAAEGAVVAIEAVRVEAVNLRMSGGGAAQPVVDQIVSALDTAIAAIKAGPKK